MDTVSRTSSNPIEKIIFNPPFPQRTVQKKVYDWLLNHAKPTKFSMWGKSDGWGYLEERMNSENCIKLDLASTYEKITTIRIRGLFESLNMPKAFTYALECTFKGSLMRGGISSNYILELILRRMDFRLCGIAAEYHLDYRRYVDDLFFFSRNHPYQVVSLINSIESVVTDEGFALNSNKTYVSF